MLRVYVAGPYTKGDVAVNVRATIDAADKLASLGHEVFLPHLSHFWHLIHPHDWQFWIRRDMAWLSLCDVFLRLPGESEGADIEEAEARRLGLRICRDINEVPHADEDG